MNLYIMVGIPGSGKSTFIERHKKEDDIVISTDEIRKELGDVSDQSKNAKVFEIAYDRLNKADRDTYFDATNLTMKSLKNIINEAVNFKDITIYFMTASKNVDLCNRRIAEDLENGKDRSNVPAEVVEKMQQKFLQLVHDLEDVAKQLSEMFSWHKIRFVLV